MISWTVEATHNGLVCVWSWYEVHLPPRLPVCDPLVAIRVDYNPIDLGVISVDVIKSTICCPGSDYIFHYATSHIFVREAELSSTNDEMCWDPICISNRNSRKWMPIAVILPK